MITKTTKIAIIVAVLSVGTIATISLLDTKAYAGFPPRGGHPDPVTTQIHGPLLSFHGSNASDFVSVSIAPFPDQPTKVWLDYQFFGDAFSFGEGCIMDKKDARNNHVHFNTTELVCLGQRSGGNFTLDAQLTSPNGFERNSFSGDREFCFTQRDGFKGPLVLWCNQVTGHAESQSRNGTATVTFNGVEVEFDLDADIDDFGVFNHAFAGKCNVKLEGDPVMFSFQIREACQIFRGFN